jgi:hypothetical protein
MEFPRLVSANDWLFCYGQDIDEDFEDCEDEEYFDEEGYFDDEDAHFNDDFYRVEVDSEDDEDDGDWDGNN